MEQYPTGAIHSIKINEGDVIMTYAVGGEFMNKAIKICEIIRDENNYHFFGKIRYLIYVKKKGDKEIFCWKTLFNDPIAITHKI